MPRGTAIRHWTPVAAIAALAGTTALAILGMPAWSTTLTGAAGAAAIGVAAMADRRRTVASLSALEQRASAARTEAGAGTAEVARLATLLDSLAEAVLGTNQRGEVVLWNGAMAQLTGMQPERALNRPLEEVFTHAEIARIHAAAREGRQIREQTPIARLEGPRVWQIAASPVVEGAAGVWTTVMSIRDVTDEARSIQIKTDFVANASHELRTPIAAMRMALETLAGLDEHDEAARIMRDRLLAMLSGNVGRMEEMVRDLLDLGRLESPEAALHIDVVPASELAAALTEDFAPACQQRRLTLAFDLAPELESMRTDRKLLSLALSNLIDNATKFAFEGTEIRVVGRPMPADNGGRGARFEVIDRGVGIPLNQQARVFERYYQVDQARDGGRTRRGTGLGLAIVKHAVRRLGGTIRVNSVWQQGTTMTVELPGGLAPSAAAGSPPPPGLPGGSESR